MVKNVCQTYLKGLKEFHFKLFLALALASGATRPCLRVSEHPPNPQFQGLKIDLCGYRRPNYFSRSAPVPIPPSRGKTLPPKYILLSTCTRRVFTNFNVLLTLSTFTYPTTLLIIYHNSLNRSNSLKIIIQSSLLYFYFYAYV